VFKNVSILSKKLENKASNDWVNKKLRRLTGLNRLQSPVVSPDHSHQSPMSGVVSKQNLNPMSMSAEMFKSDEWLGKYKKYSGDTGSTGLPGSLIQSTANLQSNFSLGNGMGKISSSNILNRSTLRFDQSMDNEYLMPGNANYKKPRKVIYESSDQDKVKIKIAKKN